MNKLAAVALICTAVACLDFDRQFADTAARLADGGLDAGSDGGAPRDGGVDAGLSCDASLCLLGKWSTDTSTIHSMRGLAAGDEPEFVIPGVRRDNGAPSNQEYETWFGRAGSDGGLTFTKSTNSRQRPNSADAVSGLANDFWFADYNGVFHYDGTDDLDVTPTACLNGGAEPGWTYVRRLNADEGLVAGGGVVVCRVNWRTGTSTALINLGLGYRPWIMGLYYVPDAGPLYMADEYAQVLGPDGGVVGGPFVATPSSFPNGDAISALDGTGSQVWLVTAEGLVFNNASGSFTQAFDAGIVGYDLRAFAPDDVWVTGSGPTVFHFDGAQWQTFRIPNVGNLGYVNSVEGGRRYLHFSACTGRDSNFNCAQSFVVSYLRGPR